MPYYMFPLITIALVCLLSGPIALIMVIILSFKVKKVLAEKSAAKKTSIPVRPESEVTAQIVVKPEPQLKASPEPELIKEKKPKVPLPEKKERPKQNILLEQKIGTKWILVAGVITLFVGVAFFLKFVYENFSLSPLARVTAVAVCGLVALVVGEVTRRRGYEIVAKGVTALGFAVLYAAVFSAYQFYSLIDSVPAFILAVAVTAGAMCYAVVLNEILIAFLSLLGGFSTPFMLSSQAVSPTGLFIYVLILAVGAMLCVSYRKWAAINFLAFIGTYLLFSMWFFQSAGRSASSGFVSTQAYTLIWLTIFFLVYLVMPIIYELVRKIKTRKEDVLLILANAIVTYSYLCHILYQSYRSRLALATLILSAVHLLLMVLAAKRCKEDTGLKAVLGSIGLFFFTVALPLYFDANALVIAWVCQALLLTIIGLKYRSGRLQITAAVPLVLSCIVLIRQLEFRTGDLRFIFNPDFATWLLVAAVVFVMHLIYRFIDSADREIKGVYSKVCQILYCLSCLLLSFAAFIEWVTHCDFHLDLSYDSPLFLEGITVIFIPAILILITRPLCPKGIYHKILTAILATAGAIFTVIAFADFYSSEFTIFANLEFLLVLGFNLALFVSALLFRNTFDKSDADIALARYFSFMGILVLWILLTEQIYLYWQAVNTYAEPVNNWKLLAHMYISIAWAIYGIVLIVVGFWKNIRTLRFIAIALFALLLCKIFIIDTRAMESVYRITAFVATGLTLISVSYMYQFLKKKGFFDSLLGGEQV